MTSCTRCTLTGFGINETRYCKTCEYKFCKRCYSIHTSDAVEINYRVKYLLCTFDRRRPYKVEGTCLKITD